MPAPRSLRRARAGVDRGGAQDRLDRHAAAPGFPAAHGASSRAAADRRLIGAHILGEEAIELIHIPQAVLHNGGTIDEFIDTTFNFPTRADAYKYAAYDGPQRLQARAPDARRLALAAGLAASR